jgi:hypothetical protein
MKNGLYLAGAALAAALLLPPLSCALTPDEGGLAPDGILIYDEKGNVLNTYTKDAPYEVVNATEMQLHATVLLLGGAVEGSTTDEVNLTVDKMTGLVHAPNTNWGSGTSLGTSSKTYSAAITATSVLNPDIHGSVYFLVRGTRPR